MNDRSCIFAGCVATWKHYHGGFPGGYDDPDDPGGLPIYFTDPAPEDGVVRDYNGAAITPRDAADIAMTPHFDGETYDPDRDHERLAKQRGRVYRTLRRNGWWTLADLSVAAEAPEASVSARIRDLRKPRFGAFTIDKRYAGHGLWEYRLDPEDGIADCAA